MGYFLKFGSGWLGGGREVASSRRFVGGELSTHYGDGGTVRTSTGAASPASLMEELPFPNRFEGRVSLSLSRLMKELALFA